MAIIYFCEMEKEMATESQVQRSLVGCRPWGRTGSDTTGVTEQQQQPSTYTARAPSPLVRASTDTKHGNRQA